MRSRAKAKSAIAALTCGIVLCLGASPAMAAKGVAGFFGETGTAGGQFSTGNSGPGGAAVNQNGTGGAGKGDVYIVDRGSNRIQQLSATGKFIRTFGLDVIVEGKPNDISTAAFEVCDTTAALPNSPSDCKAGVASNIAGAMSAPQGVAVDQSTGNLYVTDQANRRIDVFTAKGAFAGAFGWGVDTGAAKFELCTTASICQAPAAAGGSAGQFGNAIGFPAISSLNGDLLIADKTNRRVDEFKATVEAGVLTAVSVIRVYGWDVIPIGKPGNLGENVFEVCTSTVTGDCRAGQTTAPGNQVGQFAVNNSPASLGIDTTGRVYATDANPNNRVQAFSSTGTPEGVFAEAKLSGAPAPADVTVDQSNNHVLAIKPCSEATCPEATLFTERRVLELDSAGNLLDTYAAKAGIAAASGIASASGGNVYLTTSSGPGGKAGAFILGTLVPPGVTLEPVTTLTGTTATFKGSVNPGAIETGYHFEYSQDGSSWTKVPAADVQLPGDSTSHSVSAEVKGLTALTDYQVRLVATKAFGGGTATAEVKFKTPASAPLVLAASHSQVHDTSVTFKGTVNPENEASKYRFEYVDEETFEDEGFFGANSTPIPPGSLAAGAKALEVTEQASGLTPATTYLYRLTAFNATGTTHGEVRTFTTYLSPPSFDPCPNDAFRASGAHLPDCRAYEQASPVDKNGGSLQAAVYSTKASVNGDGVTFESAAGISGGEGSQDYPTYLASRGADSWSTQGLLPPASAGSTGSVHGWTPDFATVFASAGNPGVGTTLLARSTADRSLATVAPYTTNASYSYAGASADGSKVLFEANQQLPVEPGSPTPAAGKTNLYAWDRDAGELRLAGVLPDGSVPPGGSIAGQGGYAQDMHAISSDGSAYFTAGGQLYLRLNPTEPETAQKDLKGNCKPDPPLACTLRVSASQKKNGKGLEGRDAAGTRPAAFMAASTDGTKSFFTSSEKLTDDANTGVDQNPLIARADIDGKNADQSFLPARASGVAVDASHIYWADPTLGAISRANLDGTGVEEEFIADAGNPQYVTADSKHVYWTNAGDGKDGNGTIGRAELNGENPELEFIKGASNPQGVAVNDTHIFWVNAGSSGPTHTIAQANLDGSEPKQDFISTGVETPHGVAVNATNVFWTANNGAGISFVVRRDLDGTNEEFKFDGANLRGIAVDDSHVYWVRQSANAIGRIDVDLKTGFEPNFITGIEKPKGLAADASHIYWSANGEVSPNPGNDLYRFDVDTGDLIDLAPDAADTNGGEVQGVLGASDDGTYAYFVANGALALGASPGTCQGPLENPTGTCNLYLWHDDGTPNGATTFIARLDASGKQSGDAANWALSPSVFVDSTFQKTSRVSADGLTLLFRSQRQLTSYDNKFNCGAAGLSTCPEFYRYQVGDPGPTCLSCNPTGAPPSSAGPPRLGSIQPPGSGFASRPAPILSRNLSADGNRVFFESTDALLASDTNGDMGCPTVGSSLQSYPACQDVYMWEANGTGSCESEAQNGGCLYLISTGKGSTPSFFADASASGEDAFIFTESQLVGQDGDELLDVYDARVGGGLASQHEVAPVPCEGEACKSGAKEAPPSESAGTAGFAASGNPPVNRKPQRCPKSKRLVRSKGKTRCVAKRNKRHNNKRHNRNANTTRRASR